MFGGSFASTQCFKTSFLHDLLIQENKQFILNINIMNLVCNSPDTGEYMPEDKGMILLYCYTY